MNRIRAFQESRALLTAVELDLFSAVGQGATAAEVASRLQTDERATEMLMNALVALGMLQKKKGVFRNTRLAAQYFTEGSPENVRLAMMHTAYLWDRWSTLTECVRTGTSQQRANAGERDRHWTEAFIAAMDRNVGERAPLVIKAVDTSGVRRMLDVGGGSGGYSIAFAKASPELHAEVLDLPAVLALTEQYIEKSGLAERVKTRAGDLQRDEFGHDYDLVFVSAICHMLGPAENQDLFRRCFAALALGGRIVVQDFILKPDKTAPRQAALFALNWLVVTRKGNSYSADEYSTWLGKAGFRDIRHVLLPGSTGLMVGSKC
jgi:predicted O-methyltransferase YrrM/DNA-binding CsgD family transcriptional regulator